MSSEINTYQQKNVPLTQPNLVISRKVEPKTTVSIQSETGMKAMQGLMDSDSDEWNVTLIKNI